MDSAPGSETALLAFQSRVRAWLAEEAPRHGWLHDASAPRVDVDEGVRLDRARRCQRMLHDAGFAGITWPEEHGGQGLTNREQVVFNREAAHYDLPITPFIIGLGMCGPTILAHGTDEQKARHLRPLLRGDEIWCQLFSEPAAGSDLASLRTRAERDGVEWRLTGQKVWTSGATHSAHGMVLARSNPDVAKHRGLTMFIVDMTAPGVEVRPLRQMSGASHFSEVFLDGVRAEALGEIDGGWRTAITTLMNERVSIGTGPSNYGHAFAALAAAFGGAEGLDELGRHALVDVLVRERLVGLLGRRTNDAILAGRQPGPEGSVAKLMGTALAKRSAGVGAQLAGPAAQAHRVDDPAGGRWADVLTSAPGLSIAGGTDEVLRNVVAERVLGLPKEPDPGRARPPAAGSV